MSIFEDKNIENEIKKEIRRIEPAINKIEDNFKDYYYNFKNISEKERFRFLSEEIARIIELHFEKKAVITRFNKNLFEDFKGKKNNPSTKEIISKILFNEYIKRFFLNAAEEVTKNVVSSKFIKFTPKIKLATKLITSNVIFSLFSTIFSHIDIYEDIKSKREEKDKNDVVLKKYNWLVYHFIKEIGIVEKKTSAVSDTKNLLRKLYIEEKKITIEAVFLFGLSLIKFFKRRNSYGLGIYDVYTVELYRFVLNLYNVKINIHIALGQQDEIWINKVVFNHQFSQKFFMDIKNTNLKLKYLYFTTYREIFKGEKKIKLPKLLLHLSIGNNFDQIFSRIGPEKERYVFEIDKEYFADNRKWKFFKTNPRKNYSPFWTTMNKYKWENFDLLNMQLFDRTWKGSNTIKPRLSFPITLMELTFSKFPEGNKLPNTIFEGRYMRIWNLSDQNNQLPFDIYRGLS